MKLVVIGGCGHVGLPLSIMAAVKGVSTTIYDINPRAIENVRSGKMPFVEYGAEELLQQALASGKMELTDKPDAIAEADIVVMVVGTPVDEYLNPRINVVFDALDACLPYFRDGQTLILRSTVYPGVSAKVQEYFRAKGLDVEVAFCPERIAQGYAIHELQKLPQLISAFSPRGYRMAREFFSTFAQKVIELKPLEAELAKLFSNTYRYIEFAIVNQFYMIAESEGADYRRIEAAMKDDYPRLAKMPGPGFAAGPCLLKDTMQLASFYHHHFSLGHAAVWVNEGLPDFIVEQLKGSHSLKDKTVGVLGMAFKGDNDDKRDSLSYRLRKLLRLEAKDVLCHDPFIQDKDFLPLEEVMAKSDILVIGTPHSAYRNLEWPAGKPVIDIWNIVPQGNGAVHIKDEKEVLA